MTTATTTDVDGATLSSSSRLARSLRARVSENICTMLARLLSYVGGKNCESFASTLIQTSAFANAQTHSRARDTTPARRTRTAHVRDAAGHRARAREHRHAVRGCQL